jgi:hypothetical protein
MAKELPRDKILLMQDEVIKRYFLVREWKEGNFPAGMVLPNHPSSYEELVPYAKELARTIGCDFVDTTKPGHESQLVQATQNEGWPPVFDLSETGNPDHCA